MKRRTFIQSAGFASAGFAISGIPQFTIGATNELFFKISLAEWSLRDLIWAKEITNLDFPKFTKDTFGIDAVEYVSSFFTKKEGDSAYLKDLKSRAVDNGVENVLIMVDMYSEKGKLASPNKKIRKAAAENHHVWVDAASYLGCHTIRVNAFGYEKDAARDQVQDDLADGLSRLVEYSRNSNINIVVENHGGYSSDAQWLVGVMRKVNDPFCGTLPDFGNFTISKDEKYDPYKGTEELMEMAKGVSAKSVDFDESGNEKTVDYFKLMKIVKEAGYTGRVGIEWGGSKKGLFSPIEGVKKTQELLIKAGKELS